MVSLALPDKRIPWSDRLSIVLAPAEVVLDRDSELLCPDLGYDAVIVVVVNASLAGLSVNALGSRSSMAEATEDSDALGSLKPGLGDGFGDQVVGGQLPASLSGTILRY